MDTGPSSGEKGGSARRSRGITWHTEDAPSGPSEGSKAVTAIRRRRARRQWIILGALVVVLVALGIAAVPLFQGLQPAGPAPAATGRPGRDDLEKIAAAQKQFRDLDPEGSGKKSYWRRDVAGLCGFQQGGRPIGLIEDALAGADDRPVLLLGPGSPRNAKGGYWFRSLKFAGEEEPDPDRFAACAFPASYGEGGRLTFIVSQDGVVYRKDLGHGNGVQTYPADPPGEGWSLPD